MKTIYWYLHTGFPGCSHEGEFEIHDDATPDEIEEAAKDEAFGNISWGWTDKAPENESEDDGDE